MDYVGRFLGGSEEVLSHKCRMGLNNRQECRSCIRWPVSSRPLQSLSLRESTHRGKRIAVVVPAYNEEPLIGDALTMIPYFIASELCGE